MSARISIALATYNGAQFLEAQLASLAAQSLKPAELVVGDDGSDDATVAMLRAVAEEAPFPVRILDGSGPGGATANFSRVVAECTGDIIAFCDQDDVWHADKLARVAPHFDGADAPWVVIHDAAICTADGQPTGRSILGQLRAAGQGPGGLVAGCCMAFDARLAVLLSQPELPREHDAPISDFAQKFGLVRRIEDVLIDYRRHGANESESWMSGVETARRGSPLRHRIGRALREDVRDRLTADHARLLAMVRAAETLESSLVEQVGRTSFAAGMASLHEDLERIEIRRGVVAAPAVQRPFRAARAAMQGAYRKGGVASLVRDLFA